jgi:O-acetyl-ADP-ribose deacetylase (regulator of RNase III)
MLLFSAEAGLMAQSTVLRAQSCCLPNAGRSAECPTGEARLTRGYRLSAPHVIHTVGPVWHGGNAGEPETLAICYRSCLEIARSQQFRNIAFPAIATGIYGFPRQEAANIAVAMVASHLAVHEFPDRVMFVCFDEATREAYRSALGR